MLNIIVLAPNITVSVNNGDALQPELCNEEKINCQNFDQQFSGVTH